MTLAVVLTPVEAGAEPQGPPAARAAPPLQRMEARHLAQVGLERFRAHRDSEALALFRQASALVDAPTLKVLEGRALVRLNRLKEARRVFEDAAHAQLSPQAPPAYEKAKAQARRWLADVTRRMPRIRVTGSGERAYVDGETVFLSAGQALVQVDPGKHAVYRGPDRARIVNVAVYQTVNVDLDEDTTPAQTRWGWVSLGAGAAAVTGGVVLSALAIHHKRSADEPCSNNDCAAARDDDLAHFRTERALATTSYTLGIVGMGLGVALLSSSSGHGDGERRRAAMTFRATPVSASVSGVF